MRIQGTLHPKGSRRQESLADRSGAAPVLLISLTIFGAALALGTFSGSIVLLGAAFPIIALAGGAAVALPYALLMNLTPSGNHGTVAGLFDVSSGVGTLLGPTITGVFIDLLARSSVPPMATGRCGQF